MNVWIGSIIAQICPLSFFLLQIQDFIRRIRYEIVRREQTADSSRKRKKDRLIIWGKVDPIFGEKFSMENPSPAGRRCLLVLCTIYTSNSRSSLNIVHPLFIRDHGWKIFGNRVRGVEMRSEGRGRPIQIQMLIDPVMDPSRGPLCLSATMRPSSSLFSWTLLSQTRSIYIPLMYCCNELFRKVISFSMKRNEIKNLVSLSRMRKRKCKLWSANTLTV